MARTYAVIKAAMVTDIRANYSVLNNFLLPGDIGYSQVSVFNAIVSVAAFAIYTLEVILDTTTANITAIASTAAPGNIAWVQKQFLTFQYGYTLTLNSLGVPYYSTIDTTARIVTQCAITQSPSGTLNIKLAQGVGTLSALTAPQLTAVKDYYFGTQTTQGIGFAGVNANIISLNPDRLYVQATIYFYGQYLQATVQTNVVAAMNSFLATFSTSSFGGTIYMDRLRAAIESVPGVSRVAFQSIKGRDSGTVLGSATVIDIQQSYSTLSGYVIQEDTVSNTFNDTLTYTQES